MAKHLYVLVGIALLLLKEVSAQAVDSVKIAEKEVVLVVPFNRFDFHTEFSIRELSQINGVETSEVYDLVSQSLLNSFVQVNCDNFEYRIISDFHLNYLKRRISYSMSRKPVYYAADLSLLQQSDMNQLMRDYNASYILFINWYQIKKDNKVETVEGMKSSVMSRHFVDYELCNDRKEMIAWAHEYTFKPIVNKEVLKTMGLRINDLQSEYRLLPVELCKELPAK